MYVGCRIRWRGPQLHQPAATAPFITTLGSCVTVVPFICLNYTKASRSCFDSRSRFQDPCGVLAHLGGPTPGAFIAFVCLLQINGQDVQNRQEAVAALSSDECTSIVLLVARPETQVGDVCTTEEWNRVWDQRPSRRVGMGLTLGFSQRSPRPNQPQTPHRVFFFFTQRYCN